MIKDCIAYTIAAIGFIAVFVVPVVMIGPHEFFSGVLDLPSEPEFGSPAAGYIVLAYIFSMPLLGITLLVCTVRRFLKAR